MNAKIASKGRKYLIINQDKQNRPDMTSKHKAHKPELQVNGIVIDNNKNILANIHPQNSNINHLIILKNFKMLYSVNYILLPSPPSNVRVIPNDL
eukprot:313504-Ditylum_brightwellii.AAC.1